MTEIMTWQNRNIPSHVTFITTGNYGVIAPGDQGIRDSLRGAPPLSLQCTIGGKKKWITPEKIEGNRLPGYW